MEDKFEIKNPLLHEAIWGDDGCQFGSTGYINANTCHLGRAFIE